RAATSETLAYLSRSARNLSRASENWPRVNSLCADSKAFKAAASSCVGRGCGTSGTGRGEICAEDFFGFVVFDTGRCFATFLLLGPAPRFFNEVFRRLFFAFGVHLFVSFLPGSFLASSRSVLALCRLALLGASRW